MQKDLITGVPDQVTGGVVGMAILWFLMRIFAPYAIRMMEWRDKALAQSVENDMARIADLAKGLEQKNQELVLLTYKNGNLKSIIARYEAQYGELTPDGHVPHHEHPPTPHKTDVPPTTD